jgi:hypothetical protein
MSTGWRTTVTSLAVMALACASPRGGTAPQREIVVHQAHEGIPDAEQMALGEERQAYRAAVLEELRGNAAHRQGARGEREARERFAAAADAYLAFLERFPGTGWELAIRHHAAALRARAQQWDEAAALAEGVATDPATDPKSRALARLLLANVRADAGQIPPLRIVPAHERDLATVNPRPLAPAWADFVTAAREYLAPREGASAGAPASRTGVSDAELALAAARAELAHDRVAEARELLARVLEAWPDDARTFESAAPLHLETFLLAGDREGYRAALARVREVATAQARTAPEWAKARYEETLDHVETLDAAARFAAAQRLLEAGQAAQAAAAFEELATGEGSEAALALNAAGVAWDRAGAPEKAAAARQRILDAFGDSEVAPGAALALAAHHARTGDHAEAARRYAEYVERWPDAEHRCTALRNGSIAFDQAKLYEAAAETYLAFGRDPRCAEASPNAAAVALHRAGTLLLHAKRRDEAREAFRAAVEVKGVTEDEAKRVVADARKRMGG